MRKKLQNGTVTTCDKVERLQEEIGIARDFHTSVRDSLALLLKAIGKVD